MEKKKKVVVLVLVLVGVVVALSTGMLAAQSDKNEVSSVIIPALENASVSPMKGNWSDYFNYSVNVSFYKEIEIELWIYHPAEHDWISCGIQEYNKSEGDWQTLWWNMTLFSQECKGESSSYKFTWNKTLLKMDGKARFFGPRISDEYDGYDDEPKPKVNFKPASVEPEIGSSETRYIYSVTMTATKKGIICLEIQSPMGGYFKPVGCYDYNRIDDEPVPYKWNVTSEGYCNKEIGKGKYRFYFQDDTGTKISSKVYEGPEVIIEQFPNFSVNPDRGLNSTFFNFTADLNTTKEGNTKVTLQVRSDKADWIDVTNKSYENDGKSIPITFDISIDTSNIPEKENLMSEWRKNEVIEWRVKGLINESSTINTTYDIGLTWHDPSFSQEEGWWNDTFNFTVNVSADINGCVELKVKCKSIDWKSVGNWSYNNTPNPQALSWEGVRVCEELYEGSTNYNFTFHCGDIQYPSPTYDGPRVFVPLNLSLEDGTVEPEKGGYYNFTGGYFRNTTKPLFDYSIEVTADKPTTIKLVLIDPDDKKHEIEEKCEYKTPGQPQECSWKWIELPVIKIGMWNYTFKYYDTRYGWKEIKKTFEGPEMIAVFENYTVDPDPYEFGDLVDVTVCMRGTKAMNVTLEAFNLWPNQKKWEKIETELYEPKGVKCLNWTIDTFEVPFDELRLKVEE